MLKDHNEKLIRVVVAIIKKNGKLLVAERPPGKPYSGYWEFPGGKIEANEESAAALKRELQEELGIQVLLAKPWFTHTHTYPDKTVLLEMWIVQEYTPEPEGKEMQTLQWVTWDEMRALRLLEGNWAIIEKMKEYLNGSIENNI